MSCPPFPWCSLQAACIVPCLYSCDLVFAPNSSEVIFGCFFCLFVSVFFLFVCFVSCDSNCMHAPTAHVCSFSSLVHFFAFHCWRRHLSRSSTAAKGTRSQPISVSNTLILSCVLSFEFIILHPLFLLPTSHIRI